MVWLLVILGLILFISLVLVHEWGHFVAARRSGVEVEEFGLGFPPRAKTITSKNGTTYTLNWLPLGGFVRLKGEHDADTTKGSFGAARLSDKIRIMVAGVVMNLFVAFALLAFVALIGMPQLVENQFSVPSNATISQQKVLIGYIEPGSPSEKAGLQAQDEIASIGSPDGQQNTIKSADDLPSLTKQYAGQKVTVQYRRGDKLYPVTLTLRSSAEVDASKNSDKPKGYLGVSPTEYTVKRYTWAAPIVAGGTMWQFTTLTLNGLGTALAQLFTGNAAQASQQVAGPVGIFVILKEGSALGIQFVLMLIAVISLTLAIMNILPIPALDGGRLFVTLLFRALKKPLTPSIEDRIHGTGFVVLMGLFVLITFVDIRRFF